MSTTSPVKIATFSSKEVARLAVEVLATRGVIATLRKSKWSELRWLIPKESSLVHLEVPELFAIESYSALSIQVGDSLIELEGNLKLICPSCGSSDYGVIGEGKKTALIVTLFLGLAVRFTGNRLECKNCGNVTKT